MRVLVTGASGMMGRALMQEFQKAPAHEVLGLAFSRAKGALRKVDIRDEAAVRQVMQEFKPNAVVHAAVERRPDIVEKDVERALKVNCTATETVAKMSAEIGAYMVYISTDYVFDGTAPPYKPGDTPNPLNKYGQQKLEGEKLTQANNPNCSVLRVPILYGRVETLDESAVTILLKSVQNPAKADLVDDCCTRCPTHVEDVAVVIRQLCERWSTEPSSVTTTFHWCGSEFMTKYGMVVVMAEVFDLPHSHLTANAEQPSSGTKRPKDCSMDRSGLEALGMGQSTPFREGIQQALASFLDPH